MTTDSKPKKILWVSLAIVVLILISVLAALPSILSSESGKNWVVSHLEKEKHLSVSIDSLSLSWFGPQKITKFSYQDNKQGFTFSAPMIESTASFWALLTQSGSIGTTTLTSPKLSVVALPLETLEKTSP
ncbi:MAG: hypothetical protein KDK60_00190, partial [Chlamydiia bacterium]|nr:hypothetical protein [Chlamydiia bacterium]